MNDAAGPASFGRVDPDGTVWVRTAGGERSVGQVPDVPAEEALAFFTRRYEALELEVEIVGRRVDCDADEEGRGGVDATAVVVLVASTTGLRSLFRRRTLELITLAELPQ